MVAIKASWPLRLPARAILAAFQPASSVAIFRPMAAMAVSQPSARPQDSCHTAVAAIWPEDGCREFDPAFSPPRHEPRWLHSRSASHHTLFWMAGVVISQPSRWNAWSGYSKLSHPPADGCDGCMPAIMRPGGWPGHSHRSHRPEDGCADGNAAKMARVLGGGVARML